MNRSQEPIAITGMSVMYPGASDLESYWQNLVSGFDAITEVPETRLRFRSGGARPRGGFLTEPVLFDPAKFAVLPSSISATEPDQLIALTVAAAAVDDAGGVGALGDLGKVGVVLGRGGYLSPGLAGFEQRVRTVHQVMDTIGELMPSLDSERFEQVRGALLGSLGPPQPEAMTGLVPNLVASRVANRLDFGGPAYTVDAACASSLIAVDHAVRELAAGRCDAVLAGGVHHCHDETLWSLFEELRALSASRCIRPLSAEADGLLIGEGTGVVVLKRLSDARRDGDRVYASIVGVGTSSDGRSGSPLNPDPAGQQRAVYQAWQAAGVDPAAADSVGLIEAHGTATKAGDDAELSTLRAVFGPPGERSAVIGSVKSMIGHTMPAAGVAGLVKSALALHHKTLLPTLHCGQPNPKMAQTRFRTLDSARAWDAPEDGQPRRAAVNAFGFGGVNAHVVLAEAAAVTEQRAVSIVVSEPEPVLRLSATDPGELSRLLDTEDGALIRAADAEPGEGPCRLAVLAPDEKRLAAARKVVARGKPWAGRRDIWFDVRPLYPAKTAFVYPGLEAEFAPRLADIAAHFGKPRQLGELSEQTDIEDLAAHAIAVNKVGALLTEVLGAMGIRADGIAGHSVGEWAGMAAAGITTPTAVENLVREALSTAAAVPDVEFLALGCSADDARARLAGRSDVVLSHDNAPRQSIVCGASSAIAELAAQCRADGVFARTMPFRSGFHTPMFADFARPYRELVAKLDPAAGAVPMWSATDCRPYPLDGADIQSLFLRHLVEPVRFREMTEAMYADGYRIFIQLGSGQLSSFLSDTLADRAHLAVSANSTHRDGLSQLRTLAAGLWVAGLKPDFSVLGQRRPATTQRPVEINTFARLLSVPPAARGLLDQAGPAGQAALPDAGSAVLAEFNALIEESQQAARSVLAAANRVPTWQRELRAEWDISLAAQPYLRGHRFIQQRADWPDEVDRRPVVPATTIIALAIAEVARSWPGTVVAGVEKAKFNRWLLAAPATKVEVRLRRDTAELATVEIGEFAALTCRLAPDYPATQPQRWLPPGAERTPPLSAAEVYERREMFHGKEFQGLKEVSAIGANHIRGTITVGDAPGALLDNVGQLLGCWLLATHTDGLLAFPQRIEEIAFYGPHPPSGAEVSCTITARTPETDVLDMDAQLCVGGAVFAEIRNWRDARFECDRPAHDSFAFPHLHQLSVRQDDGWNLVTDRWKGAAARDIMAGVYLGAPERAEFEQRPPRGRRQWLLGRIAVKDAVRSWLAEHGVTGIYPAEILVRNEQHGRPVVSGRYGLELPDLAVSLAHNGELGVALARQESVWPPPGIDVQQLPADVDKLVEIALTAPEQELLTELSAGEPEHFRLWGTRFWSAKEAVAKACGTGFAGRPKDFVVTYMSAHRARVRIDRHGPNQEQLAVALSDIPAHDSVVAWTVPESDGE